MINWLSAMTGDLASDIGIYVAIATSVVSTACILIKKIREAIIDFITGIKDAIKKGKEKDK